MAWFTAKEWKNRLVEFAGRRSLKNVSTNETTVYDVTRNEGQVSQEGDSFSATTMNDLEQRISEGFSAAEEANSQLSSEFQAWFGVTEDGQRGWKEQGADTVTPFNIATKVLAMFHASSSGITRYTADRRIVGLTMVVEDARKSYTVLKVNGINQPEKDIVTISSSIAFGYQTYDIILNPGDEVAVTNRGGGGGNVVLLSGIVQAADQ